MAGNCCAALQWFGQRMKLTILATTMYVAALLLGSTDKFSKDTLSW
jgi:hypothetical protein